MAYLNTQGCEFEHTAYRRVRAKLTCGKVDLKKKCCTLITLRGLAKLIAYLLSDISGSDSGRLSERNIQTLIIQTQIPALLQPQVG